MMMSDAPGSSGPIGGGGAVSIGNYKGVMLCNRPFAGSSNAAAKQASGSNTGGGSFKCGTVDTPLGMGQGVSEHQRMVKKMGKKDTVLGRHKKWLRELQRTKEQLQEEYLAEEASKAEKREKFMEREAQMRAIVRGSLGPSRRDQPEDSGGEEESKEGGGWEEESKSEGKVPVLNLKSGGSGKQASKAAAKSKKPPAWAMTESKAVEAEEEEELENVDELMDFVDNLDYDKYAEDMELKVLMDKVKERISALEGEQDLDEKQLQRLIDAELERMNRDDGEDLGEDMMESGEEEKSEEKVIREIALTARSDGGMKEVHSTKSLEALVKQRKDKMTVLPQLTEEVGAAAAADREPGLAEPKVITHTVDDGSAIRDKKNNLSKLPYLNRNPAV